VSCRRLLTVTVFLSFVALSRAVLAVVATLCEGVYDSLLTVFLASVYKCLTPVQNAKNSVASAFVFVLFCICDSVNIQLSCHHH
jgi:hypothetical protein